MRVECAWYPLTDSPILYCISVRLTPSLLPLWKDTGPCKRNRKNEVYIYMYIRSTLQSRRRARARERSLKLPYMYTAGMHTYTYISYTASRHDTIVIASFSGLPRSTQCLGIRLGMRQNYYNIHSVSRTKYLTIIHARCQLSLAIILTLGAHAQRGIYSMSTTTLGFNLLEHLTLVPQGPFLVVVQAPESWL